MRHTVVIMFLLFSLTACSKQDIYIGTPSNEIQADEGLSISRFTGNWNETGVHLQFQTTGDLSQTSALKIFSGDNSNDLCVIGTVKIKNDRSAPTFSFNDPQPKASPAYYMIGVENKDGNISYINKIWKVTKP